MNGRKANGKQYDWSTHHAMCEDGTGDQDSLLRMYGRATKRSPLFKNEPAMCSSCPATKLKEETESESSSDDVVTAPAKESLERSFLTPFEKPSLPTGIVYDERMCAHAANSGCEIPERIASIFETLKNEGLLDRGGCTLFEGREATDKELCRVHTKAHVDAIDKLATMSDKEIRKFERKLNSIDLNQDTPLAARLAAGSLVDLCEKVVDSELANGFAIIRPPGHHCESCLPFGFCMYSNVAIAVRALQA